MTTEINNNSPQTQPKTGNVKVQNKIVHFVESQSKFSQSRQQFSGLNKQYRELPVDSKPKEESHLVEKKIKNSEGNVVVIN